MELRGAKSKDDSGWGKTRRLSLGFDTNESELIELKLEAKQAEAWILCRGTCPTFDVKTKGFAWCEPYKKGARRQCNLANSRSTSTGRSNPIGTVEL